MQRVWLHRATQWPLWCQRLWDTCWLLAYVFMRLVFLLFFSFYLMYSEFYHVQLHFTFELSGRQQSIRSSSISLSKDSTGEVSQTEILELFKKFYLASYHLCLRVMEMARQTNVHITIINRQYRGSPCNRNSWAF